MVRTRKSWQEKLDKNVGLRRIVDIPRKMEKTLGKREFLSVQVPKLLKKI